MRIDQVGSDVLPKKVVSLLLGHSYYDSEDLVLASDWELSKITGIGPVAIKKIRRAFGNSVYNSSIKRQSDLLGIPITTIEMMRSPLGWMLGHSHDPIIRPEEAALQYFIMQGWRGMSGEGFLVRTILDAGFFHLVKDISVEMNSRNQITSSENFFVTISFGEDESSFYSIAWHHLIKEQTDEVINAISNIDEIQLRNNFRQMKFREARPEEADIVSVWKGLTRKQWAGIADGQFKNDTYVGWPDLTLYRDGCLSFVEVKTTDCLSKNQIHTYLSLAKPLGLDFRIVQLKAVKVSQVPL